MRKYTFLVLILCSHFAHAAFSTCYDLTEATVPNLADGTSCNPTSLFGTCNTFTCAEDYVATGEAMCGDVWMVNTALCTFVDPDPDGDGVISSNDNCPNNYNPLQEDFESDGIGDVCDDDHDNDSSLNQHDNCPYLYQYNQYDFDNDGVGDDCDSDMDGDGVPNDLDWYDYDPWQSGDLDGDGIDSSVDPDIDGDGYSNNEESLCGSDMWEFNSAPLDTDADAVCNVLDHDDDNDGVLDSIDVEPLNNANTNEITLPLDSTYKGSEQNSSAVAQ